MTSPKRNAMDSLAELVAVSREVGDRQDARTGSKTKDKGEG